jgi:hypothetical protein
MAEYNNQVDLHVKQGADYTAQVFWVDDYDEPVPVTKPTKMEVRTNDTERTLILTCEDYDQIGGDTTLGYLAVSETAGLIEIYIPSGATELLPVGVHVYDLFANYKRYDTTPGTTTWGDYHVRNVISGMMVVHPAVTNDPPRRADD